MLADILNHKEIILLGDLNWDWIKDDSNELKALINIIVINKPNKCRQIGIFPNDLSDHCAIRIIQLV